MGRNGDGKTTLLELLTGVREPDSGRVTRTGSTSVGYLRQADEPDSTATVRAVIVGGQPDHVWAAQAGTRAVVEHLLAGVDLDAPLATLSGGERRRVGLAELLLADHDLLVLDEPTNHLDVDAVDWLAEQLRTRQARDRALLVVSHDRWFLDAICTRIWEVHDGSVEAYDGGYAAYVLARAERARQAAGVAARRRNLLRKELAWLRRGPPARTAKPRFRIDAANALIADEPPPRDRLALQQFATRRLGKDVFDLQHVTLSVPSQPPRVLLRDLSWSIGPGMRIGLVGANGSGKTSLLRLLLGEQQPDAGTIKRGRTLQIGYLSQTVAELQRVGAGAGVGRAAAPPDPAGHRPGGQCRHAAGGLRVHRRAADHPARRPLRRRAAAAAVPPAAAGRAQRAAARRAHQRPGHRHPHRAGGLPRLLAGHPASW